MMQIQVVTKKAENYALFGSKAIKLEKSQLFIAKKSLNIN
jgi:hypothetical protein